MPTNLPKGHRRCEHCHEPVLKGFTHMNPNTARWRCKAVNWKRRALAAEREVERMRRTACGKCGVYPNEDFE